MAGHTKAAGLGMTGAGVRDRRVRLRVGYDPATGKLVADAPRRRPAAADNNPSAVEMESAATALVRVLRGAERPAETPAALRHRIEALVDIVNVREARTLPQQMKPGQVRIVAPGRRKQITPEATVAMRMDMLDALLESVGTPAPGLADLFAPRPDLPAAPALETVPRRSRRPVYDL